MTTDVDKILGIEKSAYELNIFEKDGKEAHLIGECHVKSSEEATRYKDIIKNYDHVAIEGVHQENYGPIFYFLIWPLVLFYLVAQFFAESSSIRDAVKQHSARKKSGGGCPNKYRLTLLEKTHKPNTAEMISIYLACFPLKSLIISPIIGYAITGSLIATIATPFLNILFVATISRTETFNSIMKKIGEGLLKYRDVTMASTLDDCAVEGIPVLAIMGAAHIKGVSKHLTDMGWVKKI